MKDVGGGGGARGNICAEEEAGRHERGEEKCTQHPGDGHAVLDLQHHDGDAESPSETGEGVGDPLVRRTAVVCEVYAEHDDVVGG